MSIQRICNRSPFVAQPEETALVAAERMRDEGVGTLVVVDGDRRPVGIVTDRDLVLRVLAAGLDPRKTRVEDVMTDHPRCVQERCPVEDAVVTMRGLGVRRLPVVDDGGRLIGIVSVDDVLELVTDELGNLGRIVGWSRVGVTLRPPCGKKEPREAVASTAGLEKAASDPEC